MQWSVMAEMPPGPELDAAVAERVMGWEVRSWEKEAIALTDDGYITLWDVVLGTESLLSWSPSTKIYDVWQVVERLIELGYDFEMDRMEWKGEWYACFIRSDVGDITSRNPPWIMGIAATAPHAISLAALAAMEAK